MAIKFKYLGFIIFRRKNRINLEDCTKFSVYCEDLSWEISDSKSNTLRFLSNTGKNDEWRSIIEKIMNIQKKGIEQKSKKILKKRIILNNLPAD